MFNPEAILAIADSHFSLHLLAYGEADVPFDSGSTDSMGAEDESPDVTDEVITPAFPLPENQVEDFLDEAVDMLEEIADQYLEYPGWERALVYGFTDGMLAAAEDTWSAYEDSYYEDMRNPDFQAIDDAIDEAAAAFEGSRPWDEATKGYVRMAVERAEEDASSINQDIWKASAHAFMYGVEAGYDLEWKIIVTPARNLLITDEDAISDAAMARMAMESETGSGSLMDRVLDMIGIDANELAAALEKYGEDEPEQAEAELIDIEDVPEGR